MHFKTYLYNRINSTKFRLNGIIPSDRRPHKDKLCKAFRDHRVYSANALPPKVDLRSDMTPVEDQSKIGSCAANCLAGAYEYLTKKSDGRNTDVSRLFIYYNSRAKEKQSRTVSDSGCTMTSAIEALEEFGTCLESIWPYDISQVNSRPSDRAYEEAKNHKITDALKIEIDLNEMKSCLAQGFPFAFGLKLFKSFDKASTTGVVPMPNTSERIRASHGSHALLAVGYSDHSQSFIVRNSWGARWGEQGYCYIPYEYMTNRELCFDAWTIRKLNNPDKFSKQHWDNVDAINYLRAAVISLMSADGSNNNDEDNCIIEQIPEEDEPNRSEGNFAAGGPTNQWQNNSNGPRYDDNGGGGGGNPWYQQQQAGNSYPQYDQQQQYGAGGGYNYNQQQQWTAADYARNETGFPPNNNFGGHVQNPYPGGYQAPDMNYNNYQINPQYPVYPNGPNPQYPMYPNGPNPQNATYYPPPDNTMNFPGNGNQQYGPGFNYNNNPYNYPNQYRQ
ncbi:unnamed protein product [Adineta steineri]|uniref:Peptidase C1A papain C-terminal domain-containing protein n=1 Tax=Adineta steineri TaxID=433720 RepID=A0A819CYV6_9BILA|nr:unnamed protein product [Adineta steineri]CAF3825873.1 unnamed protein product [Adineta steineri]